MSQLDCDELMGDFVGTSRYLKMTQYMVISYSSLPCKHGGLLLENWEERRPLPPSRAWWIISQILSKPNTKWSWWSSIGKLKSVNYFDLEVIEVHNAINVDLAKTHVANVLANAELPNVRNGESFIALPSNSHGYSLCNNHKDEDLTLIEKGRAYKRIWQWKYKLC